MIDSPLFLCPFFTVLISVLHYFDIILPIFYCLEIEIKKTYITTKITDNQGIM